MGNAPCCLTGSARDACEASGASLFHLPLGCFGPSSSESVPKELRVAVPRGPRWASGVYKLVEGETANGYPLWKSKRRKVWLYSTLDGKWAFCGKEQEEAGFRSTAGFVFCGTPHRGRMPEQMPSDWMHNHPAWTPDPEIYVVRNDQQIELVNSGFHAPRGLSSEGEESSPERVPCAERSLSLEGQPLEGTLLSPDSGRRKRPDKRVTFA